MKTPTDHRSAFRPLPSALKLIASEPVIRKDKPGLAHRSLVWTASPSEVANMSAFGIATSSGFHNDLPLTQRTTVATSLEGHSYD